MALRTSSKPANRPVAPNWISRYHGAIQSGEILAPKKIKRLYEILMADMADPNSPFEYNPQRAAHAIEFAERFCKHSKGKQWGGKPLELMLWQKAWRAAAYGFLWKETGLRRFQTVLLVVGRKNGKSTDSASQGIYLLAGDGEFGAEVYSAATKKDQAKIIWLEGRRMINKSPALTSRFKTLVSEITGRDGTDYEGCVWRPLGADSERQDGLNVHGSLMDEIHAWPDRALYDVIVDGMSSREQPLNIITTTAGFVREGLYDDMYSDAERWLNPLDAYDDQTFLPIIYELDDRGEWTNPECWVKANPGLGVIKRVDQLAKKVRLAQQSSKKVNNLLTKDFNVPATSTGSWLALEDCQNRETFDIETLRNCYAIGGVDLASVHDLTCATLLIRKSGDKRFYVLQKYFIPAGVVDDKVHEDKVPYDIWCEKKWVQLSGETKVDFHDVTAWFVEMRDAYGIFPLYIGFDSWMASYWLDDMDANGFPKPHNKEDTRSCLQNVIQGAKTMSQPMKELAAEFKGRYVVHNDNPVLQWCLSNTELQIDPNENIRPVKGKSAKRRIDGAVSLIDAFVVYCRKLEEYNNLM